MNSVGQSPSRHAGESSTAGKGSPSGGSSTPGGPQFLSKAERKKLDLQMKSTKSAIDTVWKPGYTVRLLHSIARIMHDTKLGFRYDVNRAGPAPVPPKRIENNREDVSTACGVLDDTVEDVKRMRAHSYVLKNRRGNVVFIRITHSATRYHLVEESGTTIPSTSVSFFPAFDSEEKQKEEAQRLFLIWQVRKTESDHKFKEDMKSWRRARRTWEMNLVQHEYYSGNLIIFKPGLTRDELQLAVSLGKEDNLREDQGLFADAYCGQRADIEVKDNNEKSVDTPRSKPISGDADVVDRTVYVLTHERNAFRQILATIKKPGGSTIPKGLTYEQQIRYLDESELRQQEVYIKVISELEERRKVVTALSSLPSMTAHSTPLLQ